MALSGSTSGAFTRYGTNIVYPWISWSATQNIGANTSTITANLYFKKVHSAYYFQNQVNHTNTANIAGGTSYSARSDFLMPEGTTGDFFIRSWSHTVSHDASGYLTAYIGWSGNTQANVIGTYDFGANFSLNRIPKVPSGLGATTTSSIAETSFTAASSVSDDGGSTITSRGFCYSSSTSSPTKSHSVKTVGSGTGSFSSSITGLAGGTTYYIRSWATNAYGTSYGAVKTQATTSNPPSVTTNAVSSIDKFSATLNGNVTSDRGATITERGFVYSTTTNPLIGGAGVTKPTVSGTTGVYTKDVTGLSANTTYYVKAYATNSQGTTYGTQTSFTTLQSIPSVDTDAVTNLVDTTVTLNGDVTSDNGDTVTERGVVYGVSENPTTANSKLSTTGTTGTYSVNATGLTPATTYHCRAYAINTYGTAYGDDVEFKTQPTEPDSLSASVVSRTQINLSWAKGTGATNTIVRRATGSYPTGPTDGTDVYSGTGTTTNNTGLTAGTTYYYRAWSKEGTDNISDDYDSVTETTHYQLTNPTNIEADDTTYATAPANDNKIYIKLSKDGGTTWQNEIEGTLPAANGEITFGSEGIELWGSSWTGDDVDDTSFRMMITLGSDKTSYQILKDFGFTITTTYLLTGILVKVKGYFDTDTAYIDAVSMKCKYGTSILPITAGTQAYDTTTDRMVYYNGTAWKQLANTDDA